MKTINSWTPEIEETYWYASPEDGLGYHIYRGDKVDKYMIENIPFFKSLHEATKEYKKIKENAPFEIERKKVKKELKEHSKPYRPDMHNWFIAAEFDDFEGWYIHFTYDKSYYQNINYCFRTLDEAHEVVNSIGPKRILKYCFGVEGHKKH